MKNLIGYEFWKKSKTDFRFLIGAFALQILMIPLIILSFLNNYRVLFGTTFAIYGITIATMIISTIISSITHFNQDVSSSQAVFELSLPLQSWKKVLVKHIITICTLFAALLGSLGSMLILFTFFKIQNIHTLASYSIVLKFVIYTPFQCILSVLISLISVILFINVVYFCIALAKSISPKNKSMLSISIGLFIACMIINSLFEQLCNNFPILFLHLQGSTKSLSSLLFNIAILVLVFLGTSWLLENKVEC
jgi:hypothetical protein